MKKHRRTTLAALLCALPLMLGAQEMQQITVSPQGVWQSPAFSMPSVRNGEEIDLGVRLNEKGSYLQISLDDGKKVFAAGREGEETFRTNILRNGKNVPVQHNLRGIVTESFGWPAGLLEWSRFLRYRLSTLDKRIIYLRLLGTPRGIDVYFNGYFCGTIQSESGEKGNSQTLSVRLNKADMISSFRAGEQSFGYLALDLSPKFNARLPFKKNELPAGAIRNVEGVPFLFTAPDENGNVLDLYYSFFREGVMYGISESFGGRWGGVWTAACASQNTPSRFRFRVPADDYTALHVLAATQKNIPDAIDRFTVQFYRAGAGFPVNFVSGAVPDLRAEGKGLTSDGKTLHHIRVPLDPAKIRTVRDKGCDYIEFELTKDVYDYQTYPDPQYYSSHGMGLPSAVKIAAVTLERAPLSVDCTPVNTGSVFNAPETPEYKISLKALNKNAASGKFGIEIETLSWDGKEKNTFRTDVELSREGKAETLLRVPVKKYGHHTFRLKVTDPKGAEVWTQDRSLAYLRERKPKDLPFDYEGIQFGCWNWRGGHKTLGGAPLYEIMGRLGMTGMHNGAPDETQEKEAYDTCVKWHLKSYFADGCSPNGKFEEVLEKRKARWERKDTAVDKPRLFNWGTEPGINCGGSLPQYYGEKPFRAEESEVKEQWTALIEGLRRNLPLKQKLFPHWKNMVPWGTPEFALPFLMQKDLEPLIDGVLYDTGMFDRVPESQMHQCVIHKLWQFHQEWAKYSKRKPLMVSQEGPCFGPVLPGCLTEQQSADYAVRTIVLLAGYGFRHIFGSVGGATPSDYWGEQHYGGGAIGRQPHYDPYASASAFSAATRHIGPSKFLRTILFKNLSVYGAEFENIETHKRFCVVWAPKGKYTFKTNGSYQVFDPMDNEQQLSVIEVTEHPQYIYGMDKPEEVLVQAEADHSDAEKDPVMKELRKFTSKDWKQLRTEDQDYLASNLMWIRRFPAEMVLADTADGLAVTLPEQKINRGTMPHYTTLVPTTPIRLGGIPSSLIFDVTGCGDWGRIVVVLKDAAGRKWISVGVKDDWNCDDTKLLSGLNFTGRRLVRIPLPANAPFDRCILSGTAFWAVCGEKGKAPDVKPPFTLDRIYLERREQFVQVNNMRPVTDRTIVLHSVSAGYESEKQMTPEALRIDRLRMPRAPGIKLPNPIAELRAKADPSLPPAEVTAVREPETYNDGTNGIFTFKVPENAVEWDLYLSTSPDGTGALCMGKSLKKTEVHIRRFRADTDFHAFVVYRTKDKKQSAPAETPFKFKMKKNFGNL